MASHPEPLVLSLGCEEAEPELERLGLRVWAASDLAQLLSANTKHRARLILLHRRKVGDLAASVPALREAWPLVDVVIWAAKPDGVFVRAALQAGARDVLITDSAASVAKAIARITSEQQLLPRAMRLPEEHSELADFEGMVTRNRSMWDLFDTASQVAPTDASVLILGETGTGKELLAGAIHRRSSRPGRFVAVNCASLSNELMDSELFGHVPGAFTGAIRPKEGLMRYAKGGTLMLDEIGTISLAGQHRLLRALQEGTVRPVGGHQELPIDARIIAATSVRLEEATAAGEFREDLLYRLDVIRLEIPPLRERPEDVVFLFAHFTREFASRYNLERPELGSDFLDALVEYPWPGNVRQLENMTERLLLTFPNRMLTAQMLRRALPKTQSPRTRVPPPAAPRPSPPLLDVDRPMAEALAPHIARLERAYLEACLERTGGRVGMAAQAAGIHRRTLLRKLKLHEIDKARFKD